MFPAGRCIVAAFLCLTVAATSFAYWPDRYSCAPCKKAIGAKACCPSTVIEHSAAPSVHPGSMYGYYPTQWRPYPGVIAPKPLPPVRVLPRNDVEQLPPPRTGDPNAPRTPLILEPAKGRQEF